MYTTPEGLDTVFVCICSKNGINPSPVGGHTIDFRINFRTHLYNSSLQFQDAVHVYYLCTEILKFALFITNSITSELTYSLFRPLCLKWLFCRHLGNWSTWINDQFSLIMNHCRFSRCFVLLDLFQRFGNSLWIGEYICMFFGTIWYAATVIWVVCFTMML